MFLKSVEEIRKEIICKWLNTLGNERMLPRYIMSKDNVVKGKPHIIPRGPVLRGERR
jgi:hypothetical protein